ncbi:MULTISPECIES: hypothetical protein [Cryobacterium]|uniref:hypothetical protein n=1 Tax=Cryobacterium TaxID=69578 RepID=UPI00141ACCFA|nr:MULTISPECIES: hypothetical protein [Cryobacterium]
MPPSPPHGPGTRWWPPCANLEGARALALRDATADAEVSLDIRRLDVTEPQAATDAVAG